MRLGAADDDPAAGALVPEFRLLGLTGGDEGGEIADRPALDEDAARGLRQTELGGEPREDLVLGVDDSGALEPRSAVEGAGGDDEVEGDGGLRRCAGDEGEVLRVVGGDAGRSEDVLEDRQRPRRSHALLADRRTGEAGELGILHRMVERGVDGQGPASGVVEDEVDEVLGLIGDDVHAGVEIGVHGCLRG